MDDEADKLVSAAMAKRKKPEAEADDMAEDDMESDTVADALKSAWSAMKGGDFAAAADAFRAAVESCKDDD